MVFSRAMAKKIMEEENIYGRPCSCPSALSADDMYLAGHCISKLNNSLVVHNDGFHQGCPSDYTPELLKSRHLISFHKFWAGEDQISIKGTRAKRNLSWNYPIQISDTYFKKSDEYLANYKANRERQKSEL